MSVPVFLGGPCGGRNDFAGVIRMDNFGLARFRLRKKIRANIQRTAAMQRGVPPSRDVLVPFRWLSVVNLDQEPGTRNSELFFGYLCQELRSRTLDP